jgi:hypothetical protein
MLILSIGGVEPPGDKNVFININEGAMSQPNMPVRLPHLRSLGDYAYTIVALVASTLSGFAVLNGTFLVLASVYSSAIPPPPGVEFGIPSLLDLAILFVMLLLASGLSGSLNAALLVWLFPDQMVEFRPRVLSSATAWMFGMIGIAPMSIVISWLLPGALMLRMSMSGLICGLMLGSIVGQTQWRRWIRTSHDTIVYVGSTALGWGISWGLSLVLLFQ